MSTRQTSGLELYFKVFIIVLVIGIVKTDEAYRDKQCSTVEVTLDPRIGNGEEADKEEWPWHGALFFGKWYKCGCTLISEWFVLTAGHCSINPDTGYALSVLMLRVKLGVFDLQHFDERTASEYGVQSVKVHPDFASNGHKHDLALLLLKRKVEVNQFVKLIPLDVVESSWIELSAGTLGTVVGWGFTERDVLSSELRLAEMPIVRYVDCVESNPAVFGQLIHSGMYCAGAANGTSVCNGDSGGGMYVFREGQWRLRGVVSFGATRDGTNLCDMYSYAVFVNVPYYEKWIREVVNCDERKSPRMNNEIVTSTTTSTTTTSTTTMSPPTSTASPYISTVLRECLQQSNRVVTVERNSSISLACNYDPNGSTVRSIRWSREFNDARHEVDLSSDLTYGEAVTNDILTLLRLNADHSGRYRCTVEYSDGRTVLDNRTVSVTGVIPRFEYGSYIAIPIRIRGDYFNLKLTFRVDKLSGTLFQAMNSCGKQVASVELNNGKVVFQFVTERNETKKVTSMDNDIQLSRWYTIEIKILHGEGIFLLNNKLQMLFQGNIAHGSCEFGQDLVHLGGNLSGCISRMVLNDDHIDLWRSTNDIYNVTHCLPCSENPCRNGGVCVESTGSDPIQCLCEEGFVGKNCSKRGVGCRSNPCLEGLCNDEEDEFRCICSSYRTGRFCEQPNVLSRGALRFNTYGYALYRIPSSQTLQIRFRVKISTEQSSLLAFLSENSYDANNGVALFLVQNQLQLQIFQRRKVKPSIVQSTTVLKVDEWTPVLIELQGKKLYFQVDYEAALVTNVSELLEQSGDRSLYLGGLEEHISSYRFNDLSSGFSGCIGELTISDAVLDMSTSFINARNIENCH